MTEDTSKRIGDYEVLGVLGSGGMGRVFKVRNVISDRVEAMKILLPDLAGRQDLADRFLREIKLLAALHHPNIAALRTALTLDNQLVMVMEYVEGTTLATRLALGPIPADEAGNYIDQVLAALSYAHKQNVIHRDIKPANMMLTPEGVVKLMDFGIARSGSDRGLTATGTTLGSLNYMSPEQVKGQTTDARSDLYSVGVSLYEMVTGVLPFKGDSDFSVMTAQLQQPPKPPVELRSDLPAALNEIILMAMAKDPAQRFKSADAFRNALNSVRGSLAKPAGQSGFSPETALGGATNLFQGQGSRGAPESPYASNTTAPLQSPPQQSQFQPVPQPQAIPGVPDSSPKRGGHRGLYMTLGALIVLAVLVAAGIYIPRRSKTQADENANKPQQAATPTPDSPPPAATTSNNASSPQPADSSATTNTQPGPPPNPSQESTQSPDTTPMGNPRGQTGESQPDKKHRTKKDSGEVASVEQPSTTGDRAPQPDNSRQLEELEQQVDQISSRAAAVNSSLDNLRREQSAQGLGLRGDMASAQELMKTQLARAQTALQNQNLKDAKRYSEQAEAELEQLEKFLGR